MAANPTGACALSRKDAAALTMLWHAERSCGGPDSGYAWATTEATHYDGSSIGREIVPGEGPWQQVAVYWQTVRRLLIAGLVEVESYESRWDSVCLTPEGRLAAGRIAANGDVAASGGDR
jgi:hypothetical protein